MYIIKTKSGARAVTKRYMDIYMLADTMHHAKVGAIIEVPRSMPKGDVALAVAFSQPRKIAGRQLYEVLDDELGDDELAESNPAATAESTDGK